MDEAFHRRPRNRLGIKYWLKFAQAEVLVSGRFAPDILLIYLRANFLEPRSRGCFAPDCQHSTEQYRPNGAGFHGCIYSFFIAGHVSNYLAVSH